MGLMIGSVSASDLILNGRSVSLYAGGNPPVKVWPTTDVVQITLGTGLQARDQFRAALIERGLEHWTVTEIPFDIEFVGTGSASDMFADCYELTSVPEMDTSNVTSMNSMFYSCSALTHVPGMDTSSVTDMAWMFYNCSSLTSVPAMNTSQATNMSGMFYYCSSLTHVSGMDTGSVTDMSWMFSGCSSLVSVSGLDTSSVTNMSGMFSDCTALTQVSDMVTSSVTDMSYMFTGCAALTDGNVRLIGRNPQVNTTFMIDDSGLTREPWYTADGRPVDVYEVSLTDVVGFYSTHPLLTVTVPAGETWSVRVQGTMTKASQAISSHPEVRIGSATFGPYATNESVDVSGTVTSANSTIAILTSSGSSNRAASFVGTVTIEK